VKVSAQPSSCRIGGCRLRLLQPPLLVQAGRSRTGRHSRFARRVVFVAAAADQMIAIIHTVVFRRHLTGMSRSNCVLFVCVAEGGQCALPSLGTVCVGYQRLLGRFR
jgi:hypothetical protein